MQFTLAAGKYRLLLFIKWHFENVSFDWLKAVFLLLYGKHGNITPLCTIGYAIMNSMENLRFGKENYFYILVFYMLFYKRNRKHVSPCSHTLYKHSWKFGRFEIVWKHALLSFVFNFLVSFTEFQMWTRTSLYHALI